MTNAKRIGWIDTTRAIALLLVIIGHTLNCSGLTGTIIYSFHMPLFFILSGITYKKPQNTQDLIKKIKKNAKYLLGFAFMLFFIKITADFFIEYNNNSNILSYLKESALNLLFASGGKIKFLNFEIRPIGMIWFLFVLFSVRTIFDFLYLKFKNKQILLIVLLLAFAGYFISKRLFLPFSFDITLFVLPFFLFGIYINKHNLKINSFVKISPFIFIWSLSFYLIYMLDDNSFELAHRIYPLFPLCYIPSISASFATIFLIQKYECNNKINKMLQFIGKNSIFLFSIHVLDYLYKPLWSFPDNEFLASFIRIILNILILYIILKIIYFIKTKNSFKNIKNL